jgi:hypothetical protein
VSFMQSRGYDRKSDERKPQIQNPEISNWTPNLFIPYDRSYGLLYERPSLPA